MNKTLKAFTFLAILTACETKKDINNYPEEYTVIQPKIIAQNQNEEVKDFKHNGTYINPLLINEFTSWPSDQFPYFREIDLTAADHSNRFYLDSIPQIIKDNESGREYYRYSPINADDMNNKFGYSHCQYRYLGTLKNGVQVIFYSESTFCSYSPNGLFGFKFTKEKVKEDDGEHIFMKLINSQSINQFVDYKLDVENNRVLVIPEENLPQIDFANMSMVPYYIDFN